MEIIEITQPPPVETERKERKYIVISDTGRISRLGIVPQGYWLETPNERNHYEQGQAVTLPELKARVEAIRGALSSASIDIDEATGFALALLGLNTSGSYDRDFNAHTFHRGVIEMTPFVFTWDEAPIAGMTQSYTPDGFRQDDMLDGDHVIAATRQKCEASRQRRLSASQGQAGAREER